MHHISIQFTTLRIKVLTHQGLKRIFIPLVMAWILLLPLPHVHAASSDKKKDLFTIRIHGEGRPTDGSKFSVPVILLNGRKISLSIMPLLTEHDIRSVYPFRAKDGSGGAYLQLSAHGSNLLAKYSSKKMRCNNILAVMVNGRQAANLIVNAPVKDGIFVIPSGMTMVEEGQLVNSYPLIEGASQQQQMPSDKQWRKTIAAYIVGMNAGMAARPVYQPPPMPVFQPFQFTHQTHTYNGTIMGPNGQTSYINGTSY